MVNTFRRWEMVPCPCGNQTAHRHVIIDPFVTAANRLLESCELVIQAMDVCEKNKGKHNIALYLDELKAAIINCRCY